MSKDETMQGELIVPAHDQALTTKQQEVDLLQREKTIQVVSDVFGLAVRAGDAALRNAEENANLERERERHHLALATLGAETRAEIQTIEANLGEAKERTTRLAMLCDLVAKKGSDLPDAVAEGIGKAIASCAENV